MNDETKEPFSRGRGSPSFRETQTADSRAVVMAPEVINSLKMLNEEICKRSGTQSSNFSSWPIKLLVSGEPLRIGEAMSLLLRVVSEASAYGAESASSSISGAVEDVIGNVATHLFIPAVETGIASR